VTTECVGLTRRLDTEPHDLARFNCLDRPLKGRYKRHEILEAVASCDEDHDRDLELFDILLEREIPIDSHEHVILVDRKGKQFAILLAGPARLRNGADLVAGESTLQMTGRHSSRSTRLGNRGLLGEFEEGDSLFSGHGWELVEKVVESVASLQVVEESLDWDTRPSKHRRSAHDLARSLHDSTCIIHERVSRTRAKRVYDDPAPRPFLGVNVPRNARDGRARALRTQGP
jgi:hypothetical protein